MSNFCAPDCIHKLANNLKCRRKKYGLKYHTAGTLNSTTVDTLYYIVLSSSSHYQYFHPWYKVCLLVIIIRTKLSGYNICWR